MKRCLRFAFVATLSGILMSMLSIPQLDAATWGSVRKPSAGGAKGYTAPAPTTPKRPKNR
jgi:hypothetical protein